MPRPNRSSLHTICLISRFVVGSTPTRSTTRGSVAQIGRATCIRSLTNLRGFEIMCKAVRVLIDRAYILAKR